MLWQYSLVVGCIVVGAVLLGFGERKTQRKSLDVPLLPRTFFILSGGVLIMAGVCMLTVFYFMVPPSRPPPPPTNQSQPR